ncbi:hypothetical protein BD310DRAFT_147845 [Dichomitus squalens]|uniref:Uncharacterized protein n=1 Tax=Dichomitus squalens TaxID=114155 RepID=A0A4V2K8Y9_9APHY|nr:hypothetical protein BD310DRAFT_147845 [Dichomitus squalens]
MCARREPAGDEDRQTKTGGSVTGILRLGRPGQRTKKKERAYCRQFPPRTKEDGSWARQATGTGTVEWRSASVGMLDHIEECLKRRPGLSCPPTSPYNRPSAALLQRRTSISPMRARWDSVSDCVVMSANFLVKTYQSRTSLGLGLGQMKRSLGGGGSLGAIRQPRHRIRRSSTHMQ